MPSASVSTTAAVKLGDLIIVRKPKSKSCQHVSTRDSQPASRTISFVTSRLPLSNLTARCRMVKKLEWIEMAQLAVSSILFKSLSLKLP